MAVPCRRCGREYDATLFAFGRTIWCTCGSRVGVEPRAREIGAPADRRFIADAMLGRLARWLRLLGFDCAYAPRIEDEELVRRGVEEQRIILSRDAALPEEWWVPWIYLVRSEELESQLREVLERFDLRGCVRVLSRCSECNRPLAPVPREQVAGRVPDRILATHSAFLDGRGCDRVYWEGSHADRIRRMADRVLGARGIEPG